MLKPIMYKGYKIVYINHPIPINPQRMSYDILDGDRTRKANIGTVELCKRYIDTMIRYGYWQDNPSRITDAKTNESGGRI